MRKDRHSRAVVVGEGWVANMCRKQDFVFCFTLMKMFPVGKEPIFKARIDDYLISLVLQALKLAVSHAKSPVIGIIGGAIRDQIGLLRQCVNMPLELSERDYPAHWHAVADDVQVRSGKINNLLATCIVDVGVANIPLAGNRPI